MEPWEVAVWQNKRDQWLASTLLLFDQVERIFLGENMKALIYSLFVTTVLMFSAFARAELSLPFFQAGEPQHIVKINDVRFTEGSSNVEISGYLPTQCYLQPTPQLIQDLSQPNVLVLRLVSSLHSKLGYCTAATEDFTLVWNLAELAQASQVEIKAGEVYDIKFEGYPEVMRVTAAELGYVGGFLAQ